MLTLYYAPNTCSLATHITLIDAGAEFQLQRIDFVKKQQVSPEFLSINTKARVPALMTENGVLTETPAMLVYIAQTFPEKCLASVDDPFSFAQLQAFNLNPAVEDRYRYICASKWGDLRGRLPNQARAA